MMITYRINGMRFDIQFPLLFKGQPKRTKDRRDVYVTDVHEADLEEVSSVDMPVVFETHQVWSQIDLDFQWKGDAPALVDQHKAVRARQGKLYRMVAPDLDYAKAVGLFDKAFPHAAVPGMWEIGANFSEPAPLEEYRTRLRANPASRAVGEHHQWRMRRSRVEVDPVGNVWPGSGMVPAFNRVGNGPWLAREGITFETVLPKLVDYDDDDIAACRDMNAHQAGKFVVMNGESIWMECPPPVYRVGITFRNDGWEPTITICHAPTWQDQNLHVQYFSIDARHEAQAYCEELLAAADPARSNRIVDMTVGMTCHENDILAYDHAAEELRRVSHALALENHRFIKRNPGFLKKLAPDAEETINTSFSATGPTNYVLGDYGDASPWLLSNMVAWKRMGRRESTYQTAGISDVLLARAERLEATRTISLAFGM
jgi:hypothetical protein